MEKRRRNSVAIELTISDSDTDDSPSTGKRRNGRGGSKGKLTVLKDSDELVNYLELMHDKRIVKNLQAAGLSSIVLEDEDEDFYRHLDPNAKLESGEPILVAAVVYVSDIEQQLRYIIILLYEGADPNRADNEGRTALMYACMMGYEKTAKLLINHNITNLNQQDRLGNTGLMYAAAYGRLQILKNYLKALKSDKHSKSNQKLFKDTSSPRLTLEQVLGMTNAEGKTAAALALDKSHPDVAKYLDDVLNRYLKDEKKNLFAQNNASGNVSSESLCSSTNDGHAYQNSLMRTFGKMHKDYQLSRSHQEINALHCKGKERRNSAVVVRTQLLPPSTGSTVSSSEDDLDNESTSRSLMTKSCTETLLSQNRQSQSREEVVSSSPRRSIAQLFFDMFGRRSKKQISAEIPQSYSWTSDVHEKYGCKNIMRQRMQSDHSDINKSHILARLRKTSIGERVLAVDRACSPQLQVRNISGSPKTVFDTFNDNLCISVLNEQCKSASVPSVPAVGSAKVTAADRCDSHHYVWSLKPLRKLSSGRLQKYIKAKKVRDDK